MKDKPILSFDRLTEADEDGLVLVRIHAMNDVIAATGEGYTSARQLISFAETLAVFPEQLPASASFLAVSGSFDISIDLETLDRSGHIGVRVSVREGTGPRENTAVLWLHTEPNALMNLARELKSMADLSSASAVLSA